MKNSPLIQFALLVIIVVGAIAMLQKNPQPQSKGTTVTTADSTRATISTTKGDIVIKFYPADAPKAVENFIGLAKKGYYDGPIFHRVIKGFMNQTGDPTGTGTSGESFFGSSFADELDANSPSGKRGYKDGVVAMANSGPNTNGSQFFIMAADYDLPYNYTILGEVVEGFEVVDSINSVATSGPPNDKPLEEVKMLKVTVSE